MQLLFKEIAGKQLEEDTKSAKPLKVERIIGILRSINEEVNVTLRETDDSLEKDYLRYQIKKVEIKIKHLKRLIG